MWQHHKLFAYRKALEAYAELHPIVRALKRDETDLDDELKRAASSMVLNLAEGAHEFRTSEKTRFYRMSLRSTGECAAVLDLVAVVAPRIPTEAAHAKLSEVASLLTLLCQRAADTTPSKGN